jgi:hypothetical protein
MNHKNMDEETLKTMPDYVQKLPKKVQDFIFDGTWEERTKEIAIKYSLNEKQTDTFINKVLFVLIGMESPQTFGASLETELGISQILVEQILADLDTRVFQYAFDFISKQKEASETNQTTSATNSTVTAASSNTTPSAPKINSNILYKQTEEVEVPPVILPRIESDEERKKVMEQNRIANTAPDNLPGVTIGEATNAVPQPQPSQPQPSKIQTTPIKTADIAGQIQDGRFVGSEFVQKPIAVPRFNAVKSPENVPPAPQNPTASVDKKPEVQNPPRYTDPYREPIE